MFYQLGISAVTKIWSCHFKLAVMLKKWLIPPNFEACKQQVLVKVTSKYVFYTITINKSKIYKAFKYKPIIDETLVENLSLRHNSKDNTKKLSKVISIMVHEVVPGVNTDCFGDW